jgi:hypothetical protein
MKLFRVFLQLCGCAYFAYRLLYAPEGIYIADPITMLLVAGTGLTAAGQVQAGRHAKAQGQSAQNIANYNAAVMEREAKAKEQKARFEQRRQAEAAARKRSELKLWQAGTGGRGTELLAEEQAAELELENLMIGYEGDVAAARARSQAEIDRLQGRLSYQKGKGQKKASYISAGSTLLTGFGSVA